MRGTGWICDGGGRRGTGLLEPGRVGAMPGVEARPALMELLPALAVVGGSYAASLLAFRRLRLLRARRTGLELSRFRVFDHASVVEELAALGGPAPAAQAALREAEVESGAKASAAITRCHELLLAAGAARDHAPVALVGLLGHCRVLGMSSLTLELEELRTGRLLRRALGGAPATPALHLVRAHLDAALGDGEVAAEHLARAVYYSRGAAYYARLVAGSEWLAVHRPALVAEALANLASHEPAARPPTGARGGTDPGAGGAD